MFENDSDSDLDEQKVLDASQDPKFQKLMEKVMEKEKEKYFLHLAHQGLKLPSDFDISKLKTNIRNNDDTNTNTNDGTNQVESHKNKNDKSSLVNPLNILVQQIQDLQAQVVKMQSRTSTKQYSLEDIYPYKFDKILVMLPFPPNFKIPKFDKYKGKGDPRDHIK